MARKYSPPSNPNIERIPVVSVVDNVDPDNAAQTLALMSAHFNLQGVIVTGRAANHDRNAAIDDISGRDSAMRTRLNAVRMLNFMDIARPGHNVPVFEGIAPPATVVPHHLHIDELDFRDLQSGQLEAIEQGVSPRDLGLAGSLAEAEDLLVRDDVEPFSLIVGGPLSDTRKLLANRRIHHKARDLYAQLFRIGFGENEPHRYMNTHADGTPIERPSFNLYSDMSAGVDVMDDFSGVFTIFPTDITRVNAISFANPAALRSFLPQTSGSRALARLYDVSFPVMSESRGEPIFIHDIAPVLGCAAAYGAIERPYTYTRVMLQSVRQGAPRFVAATVDPQLYRQGLHQLIASVG